MKRPKPDQQEVVGWWRKGNASGFTIVELITVVAIMALMLAILVPSALSVRQSANQAKTRLQFSQWGTAITAFRSEYGYYPVFDPSNTINGGASTRDLVFHDLLAGRRRDGTALAVGSAAALQNRKAISFYSFPASDFVDSGSTTSSLLSTAFGDVDVVVLVDRNLDGVINSGDFGETLPLCRGMQPSTADFPVDGVRAGVVFYCASPSATADVPRFTLSWKP